MMSKPSQDLEELEALRGEGISASLMSEGLKEDSVKRRGMSATVAGAEHIPALLPGFFVHSIL